MGNTEEVKSACGLCSACCGILITVESGKPVGIKGDPESPPNRGGLCKIGQASLEYLYHPNRLKYPLKRVGERGAGKWKSIGWDEAFSLTADALNKIKRESGPHAVVMVHGSAKGPIDTHLVRLANAFGTSNVVCSDHVCHVPRMLAAEFTFGFLPSPEYGHPPACVLFWGANIAATRSPIHRSFLEAREKGTKHIVIDPLKTGIAENADLWLPVKPGSDLTLALGMLHVLINEGLYNRDFTDHWTSGFERLKAHVQAYTPERVAEITWVPEERIVEAVRLYAESRPAHLEWGNALDHQTESFQTGRALSALMALTGNIGIPGGEVETLGSGFRDSDPNRESSQIGIRGRWAQELELRNKLSKEERQNKLDAHLLPDFRYATPQSVIKAVLDKEPYPVRAMFVQASNPVLSWPNTKRVCQTMKRLDFLAVSDMFMTPTAALADVVYPASSYLEYDGVQMTPMGTIAQMQQKVAQIGECRSDHEIINGLAHRMGLGEYFWRKIDDFWDAVLEPIHLTFSEFKTRGRYTGTGTPKQYKRYEKAGFRTPSGKVELYSLELKQLGFDPLPGKQEPSEAAPDPGRVFPLLCTTRKLAVYRHSGGRQISSLRTSHPDPVVIIHPQTAMTLGVAEGEWAYIETAQGRIRQKVQVSACVDPRVVVADYAWWFPERGEADLFGLMESSYNLLTNDMPPFNKEVGSFSIRGLACKVSKA